MRVLKLFCGIAAMLSGLHLGHAIHHFYTSGHVHGPGMWTAMAAAAAIGILSFVGGIFLLRSRG